MLGFLVTVALSTTIIAVASALMSRGAARRALTAGAHGDLVVLVHAQSRYARLWTNAVDLCASHAGCVLLDAALQDHRGRRVLPGEPLEADALPTLYVPGEPAALLSVAHLTDGLDEHGAPQLADRLDRFVTAHRAPAGRALGGRRSPAALPWR